MMNSIAIPLKKRRKPPSFWFWWNLCWLVFDVAFGSLNLILYLETNHLISLIAFGIQVVCGWYQWTQFKKEYDKWIDGE